MWQTSGSTRVRWASDTERQSSTKDDDLQELARGIVRTEYVELVWIGSLITTHQAMLCAVRIDGYIHQQCC
jgi:L-rhamnose isomerase